MPPSRPPSDDTQRIAKLLARAGVASRREVERMIAEGRVALNGVALDTPATVLASLAGVTVDGIPVEAPAPARLFLYHKPAGLLVTERDPGGRPTIYDRLPEGLPRVVPVGRLDLATEGLLLLTTDGGLKRQLELPATGVERVYRARAYGYVTQAMLEELITGVEIDGMRYGPIDANLERRTGANFWIELKLTEGKNREVRRVLDHLGLSVSRLIRTRYGPFALQDLAPGAVVEMRPHDVDSFRKNPTRLDLPQPARRTASPPVAVQARARPPMEREAVPRQRSVARPAAEREAAPRQRPVARVAAGPAERPRSPASAPRPGPGRGRREETGSAIAKPARAARARAFREAGPMSDDDRAGTPTKGSRTGRGGRAASTGTGSHKAGSGSDRPIGDSRISGSRAGKMHDGPRGSVDRTSGGPDRHDRGRSSRTGGGLGKPGAGPGKPEGRSGPVGSGRSGPPSSGNGARPPRRPGR